MSPADAERRLARGIRLGPRALAGAGSRGRGRLITLAAIAVATQAIRLGPMDTPLARTVKVARETATLDRLSGGRLTLGVGVGNERSGNEYSITGEELDERRRASMLDESQQILTDAWTGKPLHHRGNDYTVDGMRFLRRPVQRPGVPVWGPDITGSQGPFATQLGSRASSRSTSSTLRGTGPDYGGQAGSSRGLDTIPEAAASVERYLREDRAGG